ncbi:MAG: outer membrane protein assembly factor BamE domain-containing protein [Planctomycetota bacterium]|jgi:outer membrane protein assembly factor BamE (lipoprotein component of BamABCDE complex)
MSAEAVHLVRTGMTKADVLETIGPPDTMGLRLDGSVFIYRYRDSGGEGVNLSLMQASISYEASRKRTRRVVIFFDKKGIVSLVGGNRP